MHIVDYVIMTYFLASTLCYVYDLLLKLPDLLVYQHIYLESPGWKNTRMY